MNSEIAFKWFKQALHDLEMAKRNVDIEGYVKWKKQEGFLKS